MTPPAIERSSPAFAFAFAFTFALTFALALVAAPARAAAPAAQEPFRVDTVELPGGPEVLVHTTSAPLISLRLSAAVPTAAPEGAVELLQELARAVVAEPVDRVGGALELRHEGGHAVVAVTGPAAGFDPLAQALRRAAAEPDLGVAALRSARARAEDRVQGRIERPEARLRALLWRALHGGPAPGEARGLRLEPEQIRAWRGRVYAPDAVRIVVVGDVSPDAIRAAFADWPPARSPGDDPGQGPAGVDEDPLPSAPVHQTWAAVGYRVGGDAAALAIAAQLLDDRVRASRLHGGTAEAWHGSEGHSLVAIGATSPNGGGPSDADAIADALRAAVAEAATHADPAGITAAANGIRSRLLFDARSAAGRAEVIGRLADLSGDARSAGTFLARLSRPDPAAVHNVLADAARATPVLVAVKR